MKLFGIEKSNIQTLFRVKILFLWFLGSIKNLSLVPIWNFVCAVRKKCPINIFWIDGLKSSRNLDMTELHSSSWAFNVGKLGIKTIINFLNVHRITIGWIDNQYYHYRHQYSQIHFEFMHCKK